MIGNYFRREEANVEGVSLLEDEGLSEHEDPVSINSVFGGEFEAGDDHWLSNLPSTSSSAAYREKKMMSKNCAKEWSPHYRNEPPRMAADVMRMELGPAWMDILWMEYYTRAGQMVFYSADTVHVYQVQHTMSICLLMWCVKCMCSIGHLYHSHKIKICMCNWPFKVVLTNDSISVPENGPCFICICSRW